MSGTSTLLEATGQFIGTKVKPLIEKAAALEAKDDDLETKIAELEGKDTEIEQAAQSAATAANTRFNTIEDDLAQKGTRLTTAESDIDALETLTQGHESRIATLESGGGSNDDLTALSNTVAGHTTTLTVHETTLTQHTTKLTEAETEIEQIKQTISLIDPDNTAELGTIVTDVTTLKNEMLVVKPKAEANETAITTLQTALQTANNSIGDNTTAIASNASLIATNISSIAAHGLELDQHESRLDYLTGHIGSGGGGQLSIQDNRFLKEYNASLPSDLPIFIRNYTVFDIVECPELGVTVAVGHSPEGSNVIYYTADLLTWEAVTLPTSAKWNCVAYSPEQRRIVVGSVEGYTAFSADGNPYMQGANTGPAFDMAYHKNLGAFIIAANNYLYYSNTGAAWTAFGTRFEALVETDSGSVIALTLRVEATMQAYYRNITAFDTPNPAYTALGGGGAATASNLNVTGISKYKSAVGTQVFILGHGSAQMTGVSIFVQPEGATAVTQYINTTNVEGYFDFRYGYNPHNGNYLWARTYYKTANHAQATEPYGYSSIIYEGSATAINTALLYQRAQIKASTKIINGSPVGVGNAFSIWNTTSKSALPAPDANRLDIYGEETIESYGISPSSTGVCRACNSPTTNPRGNERLLARSETLNKTIYIPQSSSNVWILKGTEWELHHNAVPCRAWQQVIWAEGLGKFIAVALWSDIVITSEDGEVWETTELDGYYNCYRVAYGNNKIVIYVANGIAETYDRWLTSFNGGDTFITNYTLNASGASAWVGIVDMIYVPTWGIFVAINLASWITFALPNTLQYVNIAVANQSYYLVYHEANNIMVAFGNSYGSGTYPNTLSSAFGSGYNAQLGSWQVIAASYDKTYNRPVFFSASGEHLYGVNAAVAGSYALINGAAIWNEAENRFDVININNSNFTKTTFGAAYTDEITKVFIPITATIGNYRAFAYGDGKFIAVAEDSSKFALSTNGLSYTLYNLPEFTDWIDVTYSALLEAFIAINNIGSGAKIENTTASAFTLNSAALMVREAFNKVVFIGSNELQITEDLTDYTAVSIDITPIAAKFINNKFVLLSASGAVRIFASLEASPTSATLPAGNYQSFDYQPNFGWIFAADGKIVVTTDFSDYEEHAIEGKASDVVYSEAFRGSLIAVEDADYCYYTYDGAIKRFDLTTSAKWISAVAVDRQFLVLANSRTSLFALGIKYMYDKVNLVPSVVYVADTNKWLTIYNQTGAAVTFSYDDGYLGFPIPAGTNSSFILVKGAKYQITGANPVNAFIGEL
ncbi:MAG: hypothetical protein LBN32_00400 [Helicobacteraceae bacterium]|jgi:hypothetical protein|nr:hypothetical protein [Helicobacteraceae bacterium]